MSKIPSNRVTFVKSSDDHRLDLALDGVCFKSDDNLEIKTLALGIVNKIEHLRLFDPGYQDEIWIPVFDGDEESQKVQIGRKIVHFDTFIKSDRFSKVQKNSFGKDVYALKDLIVEDLKPKITFKKNMTFSFNVIKSVATELTESQVPHVDDVYNREGNENTFICFVATAPCQICVVCGSHLYESLKQFYESTVFRVPVVCNMKAGERLYLHINTFHCGWSCEVTNHRLFYMLNVHHPINRVCVLSEDVIAKFDGTCQLQQIQTLHSKETIEGKRKAHANRFLKKDVKNVNVQKQNQTIDLEEFRVIKKISSKAEYEDEDDEWVVPPMKIKKMT